MQGKRSLTEEPSQQSNGCSNDPVSMDRVKSIVEDASVECTRSDVKDDLSMPMESEGGGRSVN